VQNALLFQETLERAEREQAVAEIGRNLHAAESVEEIMRMSLRELSARLGSSRARIQLGTSLQYPIEEEEE
jgi:hypothetical protein